MKQIGRFQFPEQGDVKAACAWEPYVLIRALSRTALCVAKTRIEGAWNAYCMGVPGINHKLESIAVVREGDKLPENIALAIFPEYTGVPYAP